MKKIITIMLAAIFALSFAGSAFAGISASIEPEKEVDKETVGTLVEQGMFGLEEILPELGEVKCTNVKVLETEKLTVRYTYAFRSDSLDTPFGFAEALAGYLSDKEFDFRVIFGEDGITGNEEAEFIYIDGVDNIFAEVTICANGKILFEVACGSRSISGQSRHMAIIPKTISENSTEPLIPDQR